MPRLKNLLNADAAYTPPSKELAPLPLSHQPMHPDIKDELSKIPFVPAKITHNSTQEEELEAAAEIIHGDACLLYNELRKTRHDPSTVATLINATRGLLFLRRKFLNLESDASSSTKPAKPKVISLG